MAKQREAEKASKSYDNIFTEEAGYGAQKQQTAQEMEDDFM